MKPIIEYFSVVHSPGGLRVCPSFREGEKKYIAEAGSRVWQDAIEGTKEEHWAVGFHARLAEVIATNMDFLLGPEGLGDVRDRDMAEAVAHGAKMDPETGTIHDPVTGRKF